MSDEIKKNSPSEDILKELEEETVVEKPATEIPAEAEVKEEEAPAIEEQSKEETKIEGESTPQEESEPFHQKVKGMAISYQKKPKITSLRKKLLMDLTILLLRKLLQMKKNYQLNQKQ